MDTTAHLKWVITQAHTTNRNSI